MPAQSFGNKGSSTLEIILALAVITLALSAAISLVFGNRSLAGDIAQSESALAQAQLVVEDAQALGRFDFNLLNQSDNLLVTQKGDYLKQVEAHIDWVSEGRALGISLVTEVADPLGSAAGEGCSSVMGDWGGMHFGTPAVLLQSGTGVSSMLAVDNKLYVAASTTGVGTKDFYVYNAGNPPQLLGSINANNVAAGINDLAFSSTTKGQYIYAASDSGPEVEIIDASHPNAPTTTLSYKLATTSPPFAAGRALAVAYRGGYLYVGLSQGAGMQFAVFDATDPLTMQYVGGYAVGASVNDIVVRRSVAYLATGDNARELVLVDVADPHAPKLLSAYHPPASTGFGHGNAVAVVGTSTYLARTYDVSGPEFYTLNTSNTAAPQKLASLDVGTSTSPQSLNALLVRGPYAFLAARDTLSLWDIATTTPALIKPIALPALGIRALSLACEGNNMYLGAYRLSDNKGAVYPLLP